MSLKNYFICFSILIFSGLASAKNPNCSAVKWPFSKSIEELKPSSLSSLPRGFVFSYLYNELTSKPEKRVPGLAKKLFFYLSSTELNQNRLNLLQTLELTADLDVSKPTVFPITELCSFQEKALAN